MNRTLVTTTRTRTRTTPQWIKVHLLRGVLLVTLVVMAAPTTVCAVPAATGSTTETPPPESTPPPRAFMEWFGQQEGAYYDSVRQAITTNTNTNTNTNTDLLNDSRWYTVATRDIEKGAVLAMIPTKIVLMGSPRKRDYKQEEHDDDIDIDNEDDDNEEEDKQTPWDCTTTVMAVAKELSLGEDSHLAPFFQHLQHQALKLPLNYSSQGKDLFRVVLEADNHVMLMEEEPTVHYEQWEKMVQGCHVMEDAPEATALSWVSQFAFPLDPLYAHVLIPLVDLYPHRNGHYTNVDIQIITGSHHDEAEDPQEQSQTYYARLVALRDIVQGERLYTSLNECSTCQRWIEEREEEGYGTPGTCQTKCEG